MKALGQPCLFNPKISIHGTVYKSKQINIFLVEKQILSMNEIKGANNFFR